MKKEVHALRSYKKFKPTSYDRFVIGVDIGGTNTNVAVAGITKDTVEVLYSFHFRSQEIKGVEDAIRHAQKHSEKEYKITPGFVCIAMAGPVDPSGTRGKLTNLPWDVSSSRIYKKTKLRSYIMNDFQAIGYGVFLLNPKKRSDILLIQKGKVNTKGTRAIIGAGTGLGKTIIPICNEKPFPLPSEGGHNDFCSSNKEEFALGSFIQKHRKLKYWPDIEEVLSGRGIEHLYRFVQSLGKYSPSKYTKDIDAAKDKIPIIASYKNKDKTCKEAFRIFSLFYARAARNFTLTTLPRGGLYIAGGIAAKNQEIFGSTFVKEFLKSNTQSKLLKEIPIYAIVNYDVSLYGACYAAMLRWKK